MRGLATPLLAVVLGVTTLSWGLCPCALSRALRGATQGTASSAKAPCCPRCRRTPPAEAPVRDGAPQNPDCPHCGASTRGAAVPAPAGADLPLPVATDLLVAVVAAPSAESATFRRSPDRTPPPLGPPDARVGTVVLRL